MTTVSYLVELAQIAHNHVPIGFKDGEREKVVEVGPEVVGVKDLPEFDRVVE